MGIVDHNLSNNSLGHARRIRGPISVAMLLLALASAIQMTGCATVLSEKRYPVTIANSQTPTFFSVHDRKNQVIHQGVTPQQVTLDAKSYPFWPAKYSVVFAGQNSSSESHELKAGLDPWVAGNLIVGGGLGAVIDGATGAMFKLPKTVTGNVPPQLAITDSTKGSLLAASIIKGQGDAQTISKTVAASEPVAFIAANANGISAGVVNGDAKQNSVMPVSASSQSPAYTRR
jgi:uncharacterized protein YceK